MREGFIGIVSNENYFVTYFDILKLIFLYRYDKMCDFYLEFKRENPHKTTKPQAMAKLVFVFLTTREVQLHNKNIADIIRY